MELENNDKEKQVFRSYFYIGAIVLMILWVGFEFIKPSFDKMYPEPEPVSARHPNVDTENVITVRARIIDKISKGQKGMTARDYVIVYENENKDVFEIEDALRFWGKVEKGDVAAISFKHKIVPFAGVETLDIEFLEVQRLNGEAGDALENNNSKSTL